MGKIAPNDKILRIRINEQYYRALRSEAARRNLYMNEVVIEALTEHFALQVQKTSYPPKR